MPRAGLSSGGAARLKRFTMATDDGLRVQIYVLVQNADAHVLQSYPSSAFALLRDGSFSL